MPAVTDHTHGSFSWAELATTNSDSAKKFYGDLFGWTYDEIPMGPDAVYTMCNLNGAEASALFKMGANMQGVPAHWQAYVAVDDVDARTAKVSQNGGSVIMGPFDVMDAGRMSIIKDPSGGTLALWQAKKHIGAKVIHDPGAITWMELFTNNVDAAGKFYVQTIGWQTKSVDMGPHGTYTLFTKGATKANGEADNAGGMMPMRKEEIARGVPSSWLVYFAVANCDASTAKATSLGGQVIAPPSDIPNIGRFSVVRDPEGAVFALYQHAH
jgi:predicted enzyme related to lactoylglutathione lyase